MPTPRSLSSRSRRFPVSTDKRFRVSKGGGDHGTAERWQHSGFTRELTERAGVLALRATEEHILDVLKLKRLLDAVQCDAGLRFKEDYHAAGLAAHVTGSYSGMSNARDFFRGEHERTDAQERAYKKWREAVRAMGLAHGTAVINTVCYDALPNDMEALQKGLSFLAQWYTRGGKEGALQGRR